MRYPYYASRSLAQGLAQWRRHVVGCLIACSGVVIGCSSDDGDTLAALRETGRSNVAIAIEPPYMRLGPHGTPEGLGPEIDLAVLTTIGIRELKAEVTEFGAMIPALQAQRVAMVSAGGLNITPERCRSVAYSEPILCTTDAFILPVALASTITSYKALAASQLTVAACAGCTTQNKRSLRALLRAGW